MKYKLISRKTNQETICDKVTIDGFEYYVSDTKIAELKPSDRYATIVENRRRIVFYTKHIQSKDNVVIATNNPNIDIPKVVDEVEELGEDETNTRILQHKTPSQIARQYFDGFIKGYNKSQETHSFSEEDMIEFAEWIADSKLHGYSKQLYEAMIRHKVSTTKELLQIWKEQRTKTVYYE